MGEKDNLKNKQIKIDVKIKEVTKKNIKQGSCVRYWREVVI